MPAENICDGVWSKNSISLKTRDIVRVSFEGAMPTLRGDFFVM